MSTRSERPRNRFLHEWYDFEPEAGTARGRVHSRTHDLVSFSFFDGFTTVELIVAHRLSFSGLWYKITPSKVMLCLADLGTCSMLALVLQIDAGEPFLEEQVGRKLPTAVSERSTSAAPTSYSLLLPVPSQLNTSSTHSTGIRSSPSVLLRQSTEDSVLSLRSSTSKLTPSRP